MINSLDWPDVDEVLKEMKETEELSIGTPRTWGGRLEEYYTDIWSKMNLYTELVFSYPEGSTERETAKKEYVKYQDLLLIFRKSYPKLKIWSKVNLSSIV